MSTLWPTAPQELDLPGLVGPADALSRKMQHDGLEHGAWNVLAADGALELTHEVIGTDVGVAPLHRVGDFADHVGFCHTHPPWPDGSEHWGFSTTDFAGMLEDGCHLSLVRSGQGLYALLRTPDSRPVGPVTTAEEDEFRQIFEDCYQQPGTTAPEREANQKLCERLKLALYAGPPGGRLQRVYP